MITVINSHLVPKCKEYVDINIIWAVDEFFIITIRSNDEILDIPESRLYNT